MEPGLQLALAMSVPTLAVLIGILVNNSRFNDLNKRIEELRNDVDRRFQDLNRRIDELRSDTDRRFEAMEKLFTERLLRVEQVLDARLTNIEHHLSLR